MHRAWALSLVVVQNQAFRCVAQLAKGASFRYLAAGAAIALGLVGPMASTGQTSAPPGTVTAIQEAIEMGKYSEALRLVSDALVLSPKDAGLINMRGIIHAQQSDLVEARKDFEQAVTLSPRFVSAWQNLARACQLGIGQDVEASRCAGEAWRRVLDVLPNEPEARFSLAAIYRKQEKYDASLREIEKLPPAEMSRTPTLALKCADLAGLDRMEEAGEMAKRLAASADFSDANVQSILAELKTPHQAPLVITLVEALDARGAASPQSLRQLVLAYEQESQLTNARKTLERLFAADPQNAQHLYELARVAYLAHDLEGSLGYLAHARDLVPADARVHFLIGLVLEEMQLPLDARKSLEKAVALDAHNPDYSYALGTAILWTRDSSGAITAFQNYVKSRPQDPSGHFGLGVAYFSSGDYENSAQEMTSISENPKTAAGAAYFLGRIARVEERYDEADAFLEKATRLLPSFAEAYTELARVRLHQNRFDDAKTAIERALSLDHESFQANATLLVMYQRSHDPRTEELAARVRRLDEDRGKRQELMLRSIELRPY